MHSLPVHIYLYPLAACARGEMRKGRKMFKITFFSLPPLVLDRDVQAQLSMTMFTPLL